MNALKYHTEEMPSLAPTGARYVIIAHFGSWRDGAATSNPGDIPQLKRELRKRFMNRLATAAC